MLGSKPGSFVEDLLEETLEGSSRLSPGGAGTGSTGCSSPCGGGSMGGRRPGGTGATCCGAA